MPDYKLVSLEQMKILAGKTKSYVDGKVGSASDIQSGDTVKTFSKDYKTVTTVYANGNQLVKTFSDDMKTSHRFSRTLKERSLQRKPRHCRTMDLPSLRMWFTANK